MVKIEFLGPIGLETKEIDIKNLLELKEYLTNNFAIQNWLEISAIAVNEKIVKSLETELKDGDVVSILPPVCGG
jgi:molybdopterin synthase sulfur carrier subunit